MLTAEYGRDYATQTVSPMERRILTNILNGKIRAKASMQHLAMVATDLSLQTPTVMSSDADGESRTRYAALRKYVLLCTLCTCAH